MCAMPLIWRRVELKGNVIHYGHYFPVEYNYCERYRTRLESFIKLICEEKKPVYASNLKSLKISYYHSITHKIIRSVVNYCPNVIHLDFKSSVGVCDKTLIKIASSYPNLKHLNLWDNRMITDEGLCQIAQSCNKLEYLNISGHTGFSEIIICNVICSCPGLQQLDLSFCRITNITIKEIASLCFNLKYLKLEGSDNVSKEARFT